MLVVSATSAAGPGTALPTSRVPFALLLCFSVSLSKPRFITEGGNPAPPFHDVLRESRVGKGTEHRCLTKSEGHMEACAAKEGLQFVGFLISNPVY